MLTTAWKAAGLVWKKMWNYFNEELILRETESFYHLRSPEKLSLVEMVEKAHREWEQSKNLFNEASDPELLDHAIFAMEAAEKKYIYLLKLAKKEKVINYDIFRVRENGLA